MLAPDTNDVFDKLRHSVAVSGSGLPIHKSEEDSETETAEEPAPYVEDDKLIDLEAVQANLDTAITQREDEIKAEQEAARLDAEPIPMESPRSAKDEAIENILARAMEDPSNFTALHPVMNPVIPRSGKVFKFVDRSEDGKLAARSLAVLFLGILLLVTGGAVVAHKAGWLDMRGVRIKKGEAKSGDVTVGAGTKHGIIKIMAPPPPGGPSANEIQDATSVAVDTHYAAMPIAGDQRATITSLRIMARQPTENPAQWQVLMTVAVRMASASAVTKNIQRKEGLPETVQPRSGKESEPPSKMIDLPLNAGAEGAPPPVPFISAPIGPRIEAPTRAGQKAEPAILEPQPRWVTISWSGERWFFGDYEFD